MFHPRYITHMMPTVNATMLARCRVFRARETRPEWKQGVGNQDGTYEVIWEGPCRVQPNIDWRARVRDNEGEIDATMAVRIDLPMLKNEHGAELDSNGNVLTYGDDPAFAFGDAVEIIATAGPGQQTLMGKHFTVRNALPSTNIWQHNLLCDVGTTLHG